MLQLLAWILREASEMREYVRDCATGVREEILGALLALDGTGRPPGPCVLPCCPHPVPGDQKERGVDDEVQQTSEPAMGS
jgi:hypothetical protein